MKKYRAFLCIFLITVLISGCGYNPAMYQHLSSEENYLQYEVTVKEILFLDENSDIVDQNQAETVCLKVVFSSKEALAPFLGTAPEYMNRPCETYQIGLKILKENHALLMERGFYDAFVPGDIITVTASDWIYMDGQFFYVSSLSYEGTEYLCEEEGMKNIIDHMKKNRSLL